MFDKPTALHTIGLELSGNILKAAVLSLNKGKPDVEQLAAITLHAASPSSEDDHVNPLYTNPEGKLLLEKIQKSLVVTALRNHEVLVRPLDVKLKKEADIDSVLAFQAEPLIPYPIENAVLDRIVVAQTPEGSRLSLIAARKDHIQEHLSLWVPLQIEPEVVSCEPLALALFSNFFARSSEPHFVIHLGDYHTVCILVSEGKLIASQSSYLGLDSLKQAYAQDHPGASLDSIDWLSLSKESAPNFYDAIENLRLEFTRILYALGKQRKEQEITAVLATGEGTAYSKLVELLFENSNKQLIGLSDEVTTPWSAKELQQFAIPIGAALSALPNSKDQVNFLQQEFAYTNPWRRFKQSLVIYAILCLFLAVSIYFFSASYASYQEDQLRQQYVELLATMNKSYDGFEKEYLSKNPGESGTETLNSVKNLSREGIENRLLYLQKELKNNPNTFPLFPNVPRVSDLLAWLSTHPNFVSKNGEPGLQIENLSYSLVKRPDLKKTQEHYQVQVELEFNSPTPKLAREFHDALIAPNEMVDPRGEVKWSSNRGKYKTSFFLKDKTVYPTAGTGP